METIIVIPARYGSTRFPGKPLTKILGKEMLLRVWEVSQIVKNKISGVDAIVATDDARIEEFCKNNNINYVMTSPDCATGTDRVVEAVNSLDYTPKFVVNLQGDNPLCPPWFVEALINEYKKDNSVKVVTPVVQLSWEDLASLREHKKTTPFSGTCATLKKNGDAMYFSKNIIPAIKKEDKLRETTDKSPVRRHIGLYGYSTEALMSVPSLETGYYEPYESLEQMRFLENGVNIRCVEVDYGDMEGMSGVDSPEDVVRAEAIFKKFGEFK